MYILQLVNILSIRNIIQNIIEKGLKKKKEEEEKDKDEDIDNDKNEKSD